ncbi:MAG: hypothetical protein IJ809_00795 [Clostridia bacterium]|nr:hypothetical protein [Clostridia bacterium]
MEINIGNDLVKQLDKNIEKEKGVFGKIIGDAIDKTANFAIKALPVPESVKDILSDVKEAIKTKDIGHVIKTAINSSLREGMELLGISKEKMEDLTEMKNTLFKGGLRENLSAGIETVYSKYINNNILSDELTSLVDSIKNSINGRTFSNEISSKLNVFEEKREYINDLCSEWYKAYHNLDIPRLNTINSDINMRASKSLLTSKQQKDIDIINNMTEFVNNKKDYLTDIEINFCNNV